MVIACLVTTLCMQGAEQRFYVYNATNGLADNSAQTILLTASGRLVITTMGQINFYDGNRFTYIDPTTENIYPLFRPYTTSVAEGQSQCDLCGSVYRGVR